MKHRIRNKQDVIGDSMVRKDRGSAVGRTVTQLRTKAPGAALAALVPGVAAAAWEVAGVA